MAAQMSSPRAKSALDETQECGVQRLAAKVVFIPVHSIPFLVHPSIPFHSSVDSIPFHPFQSIPVSIRARRQRGVLRHRLAVLYPLGFVMPAAMLAGFASLYQLSGDPLFLSVAGVVWRQRHRLARHGLLRRTAECRPGLSPPSGYCNASQCLRGGSVL